MIDTVLAAPRVAAPVQRARWEPSLRLSIAIVALVAVAVYANSLLNGFAYDDDWIILRNLRVHQLRDQSLIWGKPYWPTYGSILGLYRPLAIFAYAVEWTIGSGAPWVFHATNIALHTIVCVLVLLLLRRFVSARASALGALIFAVHPVHVEAVANSVGQAELIAAVGVLSACVLYSTRPLDQLKPGWHLCLLVPICYLIGLFSKEASITLPALLVILDIAQRRVRFNLRALREYARATSFIFFLLGATAVLYLSIRVGVLGSIGGSDAAPGLPFLREPHRILTAFRAWPEFVRLLFFPKDLSPDYSPAVILPVESLTPLALLGAALIAGFVALAATLPFRVAPGLPAAWFLISIVTVSNLFFPIGVVVAERTLYLPSVAIALLIGFVWDAIEAKSNPARWPVYAAGSALALGLLSVRTVQRNPDWKSTFHVLRALMRDHPESYRTAWVLANHSWQRGDLGRSLYYWDAALLLWPRDGQLYLEFANFNIARKNWKRAIDLLERSRALSPWVPQVHDMLALCYVNAERPADALASSTEAFRLGFDSGLMYAVRATAYEQLGRRDEAVGAWRVAVHHKQASLWVYRALLARALARADRADQALAAVDSAAVQLRADAVASDLLQAVRQAIVERCYDPLKVDACKDPLTGWSLTTVTPPGAEAGADRRSKSQNAAAQPR